MLASIIFSFAIVAVMLLKLVDSVCLPVTPSPILTPQEQQFLQDKQYLNSFISSIFNKCPANTNSWTSTSFPGINAQAGCSKDADCNSDSVCCPMSLLMFDNHKMCQGMYIVMKL